MCWRIAALVALLALALPASRSLAVLPAEQPYCIDDYGRLITDVYVDGQGAFAFLIDTASSRSLVSEHVQKQLAQLAQFGVDFAGQYVARGESDQWVEGLKRADLACSGDFGYFHLATIQM